MMVIWNFFSRCFLSFVVIFLLSGCTVWADRDPVLHDKPAPSGPGFLSKEDGVFSTRF